MKNLKVISFLIVATLLFFTFPAIGQDSTAVVTSSSSDFLTQFGVWLGMAILILSEIISAGIKTPFSLSILTYVVNFMELILAFIKKIRPDVSSKETGSNYTNPV